MASHELTVFREEPLEAALNACVIAFTKAGFKNVRPGGDGRSVSGAKRPMGQWTKAPVTALLTAKGNGTEITFVSTATAQSLVSAAAKPSERLIEQIVNALQQISTTAPAEASADLDGADISEVVGVLERLNELRRSGALSQEEFDAEKARILAREGSE